jgi:hypothetical protein
VRSNHRVFTTFNLKYFLLSQCVYLLTYVQNRQILKVLYWIIHIQQTCIDMGPIWAIPRPRVKPIWVCPYWTYMDPILASPFGYAYIRPIWVPYYSTLRKNDFSFIYFFRTRLLWAIVWPSWHKLLLSYIKIVALF